MTATAATRDRVAAFLDSDYSRVVGAVAFATGDRERAEDAVQDALVKTLSEDREPDNLSAWITVVAINYVKQSWRRADAQHRAYVRAVDYADGEDDESDRSVDIIAVHDAMQHLPERQRVTLALHYFEGLTVSQIGDTLGVSVGTVKTQLSRGRHALASALGTEVAS
ncbi:sigma-70 family RNA polymerase sigma factor [Demequina sp.]|uniref:RNA polymerase sigma factor n=1 Tax=Demequina sp. TaxID=2050685 RepID=UPI0025BDF0C6|nr:sigma-70 family RNA polymerase sigma factor [Demequina sp.]